MDCPQNHYLATKFIAIFAYPVPMNVEYTVSLSTPACASLGRRLVRGFTLIELIMVMVLLGILAAYAAPRIFNRSDFDARGMHDMSMAYLRYAHKTAIAQRRTVCVSFVINGMSLRIADAAGTITCTSGTALPGPDGNPALAGLVDYTAVPDAVSFTALGQPLDSSGAVLASVRAIDVTNAGRTITIEPTTGYVHD